MNEKMEARRTALKNIILANPNVFMTAGQLGKRLGCSSFTVKRDMVALEPIIGGEVSYNNPQGLIWYPPEQVGTKKEKPVNHEGYSDPTASKALKSVEEEEKKSAKFAAVVPVFGEVWEASTSNGFTELIFVMAAFESFVLGFKMWAAADFKDNAPTGAIVKIDYMGDKYVGDTRRITSKPLRYITKRAFKTSLNHDEFIVKWVPFLGYFPLDPLELEAAKNESLRWETEAKDTAKTLEMAEGERQLWEGEAKSAKKMLDEANTNIATLEQDKSVLENALDNARDKIVQLETELAELAELRDGAELALVRQKAEIYEKIAMGLLRR